MGRPSLTAFVLAAALPAFLIIVTILITSIASMAVAVWQRARLRSLRIKLIIWPLLAFLLGASLATFRADQRLSDALDPAFDGGSIPTVSALPA